MPNNSDYYSSKRFRLILQEFEQNEKVGVPTIISSDDYVDIAEYYYNKGETERAEYVVDVALKLYRGATSPLLLKARIELIDRDNPNRAEEISELIADKTDVDYHYFVAELMLYKGLANDADKYLEEHYAENDDEEKDYFAIDTATLFLDYDEVELATKWSVRVTDTDIEEYKALAARLAVIHGDSAEGIRLYKELLDEDPYSVDYWNALTTAQFLAKDMEGAISSSEYSIAIEPDNAAGTLNKASALYNLGNYEEAASYYERYMELCPTDENGAMLAGLSNLMLENYGKAAMFLQKAKNIAESNSPNLPDIYRNLAWALCQEGHIDKALKELDLLVEANGDNWETKIYRGAILQCAGRAEESEQFYIEAVEDADCEPSIFTAIASMFYDSGKPHLAYRLYSLFFSNVKNYHHGHAYFAASCYEIGEMKEFLKQLKLAIKYEPDVSREVLSPLFPSDVEPSKYYQYLMRQLKK